MKISEKIIDLIGRKYGEDEIVSDTVYSTEELSLYFKALAFYIGVSYIAEMVSKCPIKIFDRGKNAQIHRKTVRISIIS